MVELKLDCAFAELCQQVGRLSLAEVVLSLRKEGLLQSTAVCGEPYFPDRGCGTVFELRIPASEDGRDKTRRTKCPNKECAEHRGRGVHFAWNSVFYGSNLPLAVQLQLLHCFASSKSVRETLEDIGKGVVCENTVIRQFGRYRQILVEICEFEEQQQPQQLGGTVQITPALQQACKEYQQVAGQARALHALQVSRYQMMKQMQQPDSRPEKRTEIYQRLLATADLPELPLEATAVPVSETQAAKVVEVDESEYMHVWAYVG